MKNASPPKYQHVRALLEEAIRTREFEVGDQLPPEQELADRYGVSYLTARRAVCELVEADILERRARKGTFVLPHRAHQSTTTLSLITSSYDHSLMREFIGRGSRLAEQHGWKSNVIRLSAGQQDAAVRAIRGGDLALVLLDEITANSPLGRAMRGAEGKAICVGSPTTDSGAPCIFTHPDQLFHMAVQYLHDAGHQQLVFVGQAPPPGTAETQLHSWCRATSSLWPAEEARARSIQVKTPLFHCPTRDAYNATLAYLATAARPLTAIVSFGEEITQGVLAAIRDSKLSVPRDISVLNVLDGPSMSFSHPPVTSVDVNLEEHFSIAWELLRAAQNGETVPAQSHFVNCRVLERQSVRPRQSS